MSKEIASPQKKPSRLNHYLMAWCFLMLVLLIIIGSIPLWRISEPPFRRTESRVLCSALAESITQFYADDNRLPKPAAYKDGKDTDTDSSNAAGLIRILISKEPDTITQQNRLKINYLEGMKAAKARTGARSADAKGSDRWVGGLVVEENIFEMVDGWGSYYRIRLDSNYDGEILNPNTDEVADGRGKLPNRVIVWSPGKDGIWETWEDNVKSWD